MSAPRPVAMNRLLADHAERANDSLKHCHPLFNLILGLNRLTMRSIRFSVAREERDRSICSARACARNDKGESYDVRLITNQTIFAKMVKKKFRKENAARWSGASILVHGGTVVA